MIGLIKRYNDYNDIKDKVYVDETNLSLDFKYKNSDGLLKQLDLSSNERLEDDVEFLDDKTEQFDYRNHELLFDISFEIKNAHKLFGDKGIASDNDILALGLVYKSRSSLQRDSILEIAEISKSKDETINIRGFNSDNMLDNDGVTLKYKNASNKPFSLGIGRFCEDFTLQLVIYIKDLSNRQEEDKYKFCNIVGEVLGCLFEKTVFVKPTFSLFPIKKAKLGANNLLYKVLLEQDSKDELHNIQFEKCVTVYFNEDNPCYCYLDPASEKFDPLLRNDVISRSIVDIIRIFYTYVNEDVDISNCPPGSFGSVINYFKNTLKLDVGLDIQTHNVAQKIYDMLGDNLDE